MGREGPTLDDLRQALERREFSPVYLFHGEEDLLAEEATNLVVGAALSPEERGFNLDVLYGPDSDARDIMARASSFPMMAARRVVVVRELDRVPNKELLSGYLDHPSETTCLVLQVGKTDMRRKPFPQAKRHGLAIEFRRLYENQIPAWITAQVAVQGRSIAPDAARMLTTYVGQSLREIRSEIDKLFLYTGDRAEIRLEDVQAVVGASREYNIFELQRAVGGRRISQAVFIAGRMIECGESPIMVVVMLTRFFATLWRLHEMRRRNVPPAAQAAEAGLAPFQMKEYSEAAVLHDAADCELAFDALLSADEQLKTSAMDPRVILEVLMVRLTERLPVTSSLTPAF